MRTLRIVQHISIDGVIQSPGGMTEDGDYPYGGWVVPHSDPAIGEAVVAAHDGACDFLLGRHTYDIWSGYWPKAKNGMADAMNKAVKYVATHRPDTLQWGPAESLGDDIVAGIRNLKNGSGPTLVLWGSSTLTPVLIEHALADEILLLVYPVVLGTGKRFFSDKAPAREFALLDSRTTASGVVMNTYRPNGALRTGSFETPE